MIYIITYDMNTNHPNYDKVSTAIQSLGQAVPAFKSVWLLDSQYDANQVFEAVGCYLQHDNRLFVAEITDNSMGWIDQPASFWLSQKFGLY